MTSSSSSSVPQTNSNVTGNLQGGAAILAPATAFPHGLPSNALVVIPLGANAASIEKEIAKGPLALSMDQAWKLLGFNGPPVQVQDEQGRPVAIGLEDLLNGLERYWVEGQDDPSRGRIYAQELIKHDRHAKAEQVLAKVVALGGEGEDWLALGLAQMNQQKFDKAEATLRGAQNLLKRNPSPSLHLARLAREQKDEQGERQHVERALQIEPYSIEVWTYFASMIRHQKGENETLHEVEQLAQMPVHAKNPLPYIALQSFYAGDEKTRERAISLAQKAIERAPSDTLALLCLSALYGQSGKLEEAAKLLSPHESLMQKNAQLAHNYTEILFQLKEWDRLTSLLQKLASSTNQEVKQLAAERSQRLAQLRA